MPVLILEGISRCGKTSWYNRHQQKLEEIFRGGVRYTHVHETKLGQSLKEKYTAKQEGKLNISDSELGFQYVAAHLEHIYNLEEIGRTQLLVIDRSIISTVAIQFNGEFSSRTEYTDATDLIDPYLEILNLKNDWAFPFLLFFDPSQESNRYSDMYGKTGYYRTTVNRINCLNKYFLDCFPSVEEVDKQSETSILRGLARTQL